MTDTMTIYDITYSQSMVNWGWFGIPTAPGNMRILAPWGKNPNHRPPGNFRLTSGEFTSNLWENHGKTGWFWRDHQPW